LAWHAMGAGHLDLVRKDSSRSGSANLTGRSEHFSRARAAAIFIGIDMHLDFPKERADILQDHAHINLRHVADAWERYDCKSCAAPVRTVPTGQLFVGLVRKSARIHARFQRHARVSVANGRSSWRDVMRAAKGSIHRHRLRHPFSNAILSAQFRRECTWVPRVARRFSSSVTAGQDVHIPLRSSRQHLQAPRDYGRRRRQPPHPAQATD